MNKYFYSVYFYRESLKNNSKPIPIAVLGASFGEKEKLVFVIGKDISTLEVNSDIERKYLELIPSIVKDQIVEAIKDLEGKKEQVKVFFNSLAKQNRWNLFLSPINTYSGKASLKDRTMQIFQDVVNEEYDNKGENYNKSGKSKGGKHDNPLYEESFAVP